MIYRFISTALILTFSMTTASVASDHADPIDIFYKLQQEGAITDLFCFPILADESPAFPFTRSAKLPLHDTLADVLRKSLADDELKKIDSLVFIMCVRRQLTDSTMLKLEPYTFRIHIDVNSPVSFPTEADLNEQLRPSQHSQTHSHAPAAVRTPYNAHLSVVEAFARYGGKIDEPQQIKEDITIEFRLDNHADLVTRPVYSGTAASGWGKDNRIQFKSGVFDDPFVFPAFYGTNIVAFAIRVPLDLFPPDKTNFLIWGTSHQGRKQIDHVGRSLRTQNPRFDFLNTLHPKDHAAAIFEANEHPSLMRDLALRLNFGSYYAYREWDYVPDVMCYSLNYPVGFPNGRLLTDDVAAILAQHGDTLLYELSFQDPKGGWPRSMTNDKSADPHVPGVFKPKFPYLLDPAPSSTQPALRRLSTASVMKLTGIALLVLTLLAISHLLFAKLYYRIKMRKRYL